MGGGDGDALLDFDVQDSDVILIDFDKIETVTHLAKITIIMTRRVDSIIRHLFIVSQQKKLIRW